MLHNVKRLLDEITVRHVAERVSPMAAQYNFKQEIYEEARPYVSAKEAAAERLS